MRKYWVNGMLHTSHSQIQYIAISIAPPDLTCNLCDVTGVGEAYATWQAEQLERVGKRVQEEEVHTKYYPRRFP